jgi:phosphoglycolate phosphatase-like HAD superfamily hydrolase
MLPVACRSAPADLASRLLVFDFDGVLCDSLEECMLVAWYAHAGAAVSDFVEPGMAGLPPDLVDRFERCRPFMRHMLHLMVPIVDPHPPRSHPEFVARYSEIPASEAEAFGRAVDRYRAALRRAHPESWCDRHRVESRLAELVRDAYIATARDTASVGFILRAYGIAIHDDHVFGSLRTKCAALDAIAIRESRERADVVLVDDSIENCIAAQTAGFSAGWASWGYHAAEDAEAARSRGIPALTVESLLQQASHEATCRS